MEGDSRISLGRQFHNIGAITKKAIDRFATHLAADGRALEEEPPKIIVDVWVGSYGSRKSLRMARGDRLQHLSSQQQ